MSGEGLFFVVFLKSKDSLLISPAIFALLFLAYRIQCYPWRLIVFFFLKLFFSPISFTGIGKIKLRSSSNLFVNMVIGNIYISGL